MSQAYKINSEILVNTAVVDNQMAPQITALANGGFVVTWIDMSQGEGGAGGDDDGAAVKAQIFGADGKPAGGEILVNSTTADNQFFPQITALRDGGFVVTWNDASKGLPDLDVRAQVFSAAGDRVLHEILVNTAVIDEQSSPRIAALSNGGFVIAWNDNSQGDGGAPGDESEFAIKAQVFAADGTRLPDSEIRVNTAVESYQFMPVIKALPGGRFVIVWEDYSENADGIGALGDDSEWAVKAQVFEADGSPLGDEMLVNTAVTGPQWAPQIAVLKSGDFVITWEDFSQGDGGADGDASGLAVKAQMFRDNGAEYAPVSGEILVNTATNDDQKAPQIAALSQGGFVVTWSDYSRGVDGAGGDDSGFAVKAQVFGANGAPRGQEILVNTAWVSDQHSPQITALVQGGFIISWHDESRGFGGAGGDTSGSAVKAHYFADDGTRIGTEFRVNTATAGNQTNAQIAALQDGGFIVTWEDYSQGVGGVRGDSSGAAVKAQLFGVGTTLEHVKAAHFNVLGLVLPDAAAQLVVDAILNKDYSFNSYIETLVDKADLSTLPAVIVNAILAGVAPTQAHLPELGHFAALQFKAYQNAGSTNPALGIYEALGRGYSETERFQSEYGDYGDTGFIAYAYQDVFERAASQLQITHFEAQLNYFEALYASVGQSQEMANLHAKGAVIGQMIGHMVRDEPDMHLIDDAAIAFLRAAGHGEARYGEPLELI